MKVEEFTKEELVTASQKMKSKKAPRPDGIITEALKTAVQEIPKVVLQVMNDLLRRQLFPEKCKTTMVIGKLCLCQQCK